MRALDRMPTVSNRQAPWRMKMPIDMLTSDLTLAPTLGPLVRHGGDVSQGSLTVKQAVSRLATLGFLSVQLDATLAGIRPRDLSPRARQDLSALLMRSGVRPAGVDLFVPRKHWLGAATVDRAVAAALGAIEFAADLGRVPVSISLPVRELGGDVRDALVTAAEVRGVTLAIHAEDQLDELAKILESTGVATLGMGLDPAALLGRNLQPQKIVHQHAGHLRVGRLADISQSGGADGLRCFVGQGELDVLDYRIALDLAKGRIGPVVLDVRGLENPWHGASTGLECWQNNAMT